jgi:hypothetical protein
MLDRKLTDEQRKREALLDNRVWLHDNFQEIQEKYEEKWVAILDTKVVAHDKDVEKVKDAVKKRDAEAVIIRIPSGEIPRPI